MTRRNYSNIAAATTLSAGIAAGDTSLSVASATGYPDAPFTILIGTEAILVGAVSTTTFSSLTRGFDGTTAAAHSSGDAVVHAGVAADVRLGWAGHGYPGGGSLWNAPPSDHSSVTLSSGRVYGFPLDLSVAFQIDTVGVNVTGAGDGGTLQLALARPLSTGQPESSGFAFAYDWDDTANAVFNTTGTKSQAVTPVTVDPGFYWMLVFAKNFTTPPSLLGGATQRNNLWPVREGTQNWTGAWTGGGKTDITGVSTGLAALGGSPFWMFQGTILD